MLLLITAIALLAADLTAAAPRWQAPLTVQVVRGVADPQVAVDGAGKATVVYSNAPIALGGPTRQGVYATTRTPGSVFSAPRRLGNGVQPHVGVTPEGDTAVAWVNGDRIEVLRQPAPGQLGGPGQSLAKITSGGVERLWLVLDTTGRVTVVWAQRASDAPFPDAIQLRAASITGTGEVGAVEELGTATHCPRPTVAGNLSGDVAVFCFGYLSEQLLHVRAAGGTQFESEPLSISELDMTGSSAWGDLTVDGDGRVTVSALSYKGGPATYYRDRPRGGGLAPWRRLVGATLAAMTAQESRTVAIWNARGGAAVATRSAGATEFLPSGSVRLAGTSPEQELELVEVTAPLGPLPLLVERRLRDEPTSVLVGASLTSSGVPLVAGQTSIPGRRELPATVAGSESGFATAVWEQRCGEGFAVMAMVLDERRGTTVPPCQDRQAPKIVVRPKRARLVGRTLRVRIGCDERCRIGVRTRVLGRGSGRPLATTKTKRSVLLAARRFRTFKPRLSATEAARVGAALASGRRVTVRLALPVRDSYENGAVRRVSVPLRR